MNRRRFIGAVTSVVAGAALPGRLAAISARCAPRSGGDRLVERWSWAMGQAVHLQLFAASEPAGYEVAQAALAELRRVEGVLSRFDDGSDLSALNRAAGRGPQMVSRDLAAVLVAADRFRTSTSGAFDIAVEPLMRAWGFHAERRSPPSAKELAEARAAVAAATVTVRQRVVTLGSAATQLDLGGIGVGYGLDRMADVLRRAGVRRALLEVSGDYLALGSPPGESGWLIAVADPARPGGTIGRVRLRDAALATSANTVSVIRWGRALRGHVMNPATGYPAQALVQASVVARTGLEADALSTAMLVSGRRPAGGLGSFRVARSADRLG
jgi:thiamine biosynthesis lipoprotein